MQTQSTTLFKYLLAACVPVFIFYGLPLRYYMPYRQDFIHFFAAPIYWGFGIVGLMGIRLNQSRILVASILFGISYHLSQFPALITHWGLTPLSLRQIQCVALPLSLTLLFTTRESRFWDRRSLLRVLLSLLPIGLMALAFLWDPQHFHRFATFKFIPLQHDILSIPQLALLTTLVFALFAYDLTDTRIRFFCYALLASLIPFLSAQHMGMRMAETNELQTFFAVLSFAISCGILLHALITMYLDRVYLDELTGIPNRRALDETIETLGGNYSVAMVDIDHFKKFNDNYGHDQGDHVLRLVAQVISQVPGGTAYRFGGEEFTLLFHGQNCFEALDAAERVREEVDLRRFYLRQPGRPEHRLLLWRNKKRPETKRKRIKVSISIGIASPDSSKVLVDDVFKAADRALYKAKQAGRNQVMLDEEVLTSDKEEMTSIP